VCGGAVARVAGLQMCAMDIFFPSTTKWIRVFIYIYVYMNIHVYTYMYIYYIYGYIYRYCLFITQFEYVRKMLCEWRAYVCVSQTIIFLTKFMLC